MTSRLLLIVALLCIATSAVGATESKPASDWWSFQPVRNPSPPSVRDTAWPRNDIDRFILARLESEQMSPPPDAAKRPLIRRATFDLTGLPPTPQEIDAFLADGSEDAFAKVVDRLLASPRYGERWGRHWLDVVRYADTSGCNSDFPIPQAYRYRNYVIEAFNKDKPYDQFLREQIAGDLLPAKSDEQRFEQVVATGYLPISRRFSSLNEEFHLTIDDTIDNVGRGMLALTLACTRCHDHKFDPIPQTDYYALYGIFRSTKYAFPGTEIYRHQQDLTPLVSAEKLKELRPLLAQIEELDEQIYLCYTQYAELDTNDPEKGPLKARFDTMQKERDELTKKLPDFPKAYAASEGTPGNERLHLKGDPKTFGAEVPRGFLQVLGGQRVSGGGSGRLELANWIADPKNPLTARVMVNRVWLNHFGQGLVRTPDDFGTRGAKPTHAELLDWLTTRFVEGGWSIKSLHRTMMLSRAYQSACIENADYARRDPQNALLWTFNRRKLSAEELRDAMLLVSGTLAPSAGGPHPFKPEWEWRYTQHNPFVDDFPTNRRSVYMMQQRIRLQPYLATFNGADTNTCTGQRGSDTAPQQALFVLNSDFAYRQAKLLAERLAKECKRPDDRVKHAFLLAVGRPATDDEVSEAIQYVASVESPLKDTGVGDRGQAAWASYLRILLGSNEFVFVE